MLVLYFSTVCFVLMQTSSVKGECTECCVADVPKYTQCFKQCFLQCNTCPAPPGVVNGSVSVTGGMIGDVATYSCNSDRITWPTNTRTCNSSLEWDGEKVNCIGFRLVGGLAPWAGRVELEVNGVWGTICDDDFDENVLGAEVVCRLLNYTDRYSVRRLNEAYGRGTGPIWLDDIECVGNETHLLDCPHRGLGSENCGHDEDAGVICVRKDAPIEISLAGGRDSSEGRVQMVVDGVMGSICDDHWDALDAEVICRMLNFTNRIPIATRDSRPFGSLVPGEYWLDDVHCVGNESHITDCPRDRPFADHNCDQQDKDEDAGVICAESVTVKAYLINGGDSSEGTVLLEVNGINGTICDYREFDSAGAQVVCRMMGFDGPATIASRQDFPSGSQGEHQFWLNHVKCNGTEQSIVDCVHDGWGTSSCEFGHFYDVRLRCSHLD